MHWFLTRWVGASGPAPAVRTSSPYRRPQAAIDDYTLEAAYKTDLRLHQGRSATAATTYESHLGTYRRWLAEEYPGLTLAQVQAHHVKAFLLRQAARGIAPSTRATMVWAIRSFYNYLLEEELVPANPTNKISVPGSRKTRTEYYTDTQANRALDWAAPQTPLRWQVGYPLLATLRYQGLRGAEVCDLRLDQVDLPGRRMSVIGKGTKPRVVPIAPPLVPILDHYLRHVRPLLPKSPFFFVNPRSRPGSTYVGRFNDQAVYKLVKAAGEGAALEQHDFPDRWRQTYATTLVRRHTDIHKVQRLLGHSSINTTVRYLHLDDDDLADAVDKAFPQG